MEVAIHDACESRKLGGGVDEEGWYKVDFAGDVGVLGVRSPPTVGFGGLTELALLTCERRHKGLAINLKLILTTSRGEGDVPNELPIRVGGARDNTANSDVQPSIPSC